MAATTRNVAYFANAAVVTPSDTETFFAQGLNNAAALLITATGNIKVTTVGGQTLTIQNLQAGCLLPLAVAQVFATGTTVSSGNIIQLW